MKDDKELETEYRKESREAFDRLFKSREERLREEKRIEQQIDESEQNFLREVALGYQDEVLVDQELDEA